jgi:hypothetical protein
MWNDKQTNDALFEILLGITDWIKMNSPFCCHYPPSSCYLFDGSCSLTLQFCNTERDAERETLSRVRDGVCRQLHQGPCLGTRVKPSKSLNPGNGLVTGDGGFFLSHWMVFWSCQILLKVHRSSPGVKGGSRINGSYKKRSAASNLHNLGELKALEKSLLDTQA